MNKYKFSEYNILDKITGDLYSLYNIKNRSHLILDINKIPEYKILLSEENRIGELQSKTFPYLSAYLPQK